MIPEKNNHIAFSVSFFKYALKKGKPIVVSFSYNLLPDNLEQLSKDFECKDIKGKFPYTFVNELTLNYIGNTPNIEYYEDIKKDEYKKLKKSNWNLKEETLKYLSGDLNSLMCVVDKFNKYIFRTFEIQMTESITLARLALNIFLKDYLGESKIPLINMESLYNFIKQGYYGGINEVYKPYIEKGFYYDVNSLYPFSAKNAIPGNECNYIEDLSEDGLNLDELFGFFFCKVKTNNRYLGLLPLHDEKGNLVLPNGEFEGVWFSEELKFARDNGYEIKVIKGYNFNKIYNVFDKFVDYLYDIKSKTKGAIKVIIKFILNSLIGRFALSIYKPKNEILDKDRLDYIVSTRDCTYEYLYDGRYLVSYDPVVSNSRCEESGLDFIKVLNNEKKDVEKTNKFDNVSISTAAAVTSYARIFMNKVKLLVLSLGGKIYYMDTDSLVTDIELNDELVGNKLGQFKLEYKIKKGIFMTGKTYLIKGKNVQKNKEQIVIKVKGVISNSLNEKDFDDMYYNHMNVKAKKSHTKLEYSKGTVNISKIAVTLKHDAYTNRLKIVNSEELWIDTKPLIRGRLDKKVCENISLDFFKKKEKPNLNFIIMNNVDKGFILIDTITKDFILIFPLFPKGKRGKSNNFIVVYYPPVLALKLVPLKFALKFAVSSLSLINYACPCLNIILYNPPVLALKKKRNFAPFVALALALKFTGSSPVCLNVILYNTPLLIMIKVSNNES